MHHFFETNHHCFFILDFYPGGDLYTLLHTKGILSEEEYQCYVTEIILGLDYLHKEGIIYRDLKVEFLQSARKHHAELAGSHKVGRLRP